MPTRRTRTTARLLFLATAALLTTGCQLRLDVAIDVNRDGGGTLEVTVGADAELVAAAEEAGTDPLEGLVQAGRGLRGDGWRVREGGAEGGRTVSLSREFADPAEFNQISRQLAGALAADEVVLLEPFTLEVTQDQISVAGGAGAKPRRAVRDYGLTRRAAVQLVSEEQALDYTVTVALPGEILAANAADPEAAPLVWRIPAGEQVAIAAQSTRPRLPVVRALIGALGGGVVAAAGLWLWSRRRRPA